MSKLFSSESCKVLKRLKLPTMPVIGNFLINQHVWKTTTSSGATSVIYAKAKLKGQSNLTKIYKASLTT